MPHLRLILILSLGVAVSAFGASAAKKQSKAPICIVEEIVADSVNTVAMPDGLWDLIDYTVQVYGDKSRDEANSRDLSPYTCTV